MVNLYICAIERDAHTKEEKVQVVCIEEDIIVAGDNIAFRLTNGNK